MNNLMDMQLSYNKSYDTFCYQNCLKFLLQEMGVKNAEFYINKSMSLIIRNPDKQDFDIVFGKCALGLLPYYDQKITRVFSDESCYKVFEDNCKMVNAGNPVIVGVDSYYIPYLPFYNNSHGTHTVILTDVDLNNSEVEVVDWVDPWNYKGRIKIDDFLKARDSSNLSDGGTFSGKPIRNNWAVIQDKSDWNASTADLIDCTLKLAIKQYYYPEKHDDSFWGVDAIKHIICKLNNIENESEEKQSAGLKRLHKGIYKLGKRRNFWRDFLFLAQNTNIYNLGTILEKQDSINSMWDKWSYRLIKCTMKRKPGYSEKLKEELSILLYKEKEIGEMISND